MPVLLRDKAAEDDVRFPNSGAGRCAEEMDLSIGPYALAPRPVYGVTPYYANTLLYNPDYFASYYKVYDVSARNSTRVDIERIAIYFISPDYSVSRDSALVPAFDSNLGSVF
ncbi:hypothetical protein EVAR_22332_1 [Eumeta japonica]|uniref:Uncharacterized protein n=1 Tax=Eumeta variegata TaxID=151549 RepID=A0A4C1UC03_EUMVA|nr:hypothetical protein EVAR_22332_1 [Eumeta japonica]